MTRKSTNTTEGSAWKKDKNPHNPHNPPPSPPPVEQTIVEGAGYAFGALLADGKSVAAKVAIGRGSAAGIGVTNANSTIGSLITARGASKATGVAAATGSTGFIASSQGSAVGHSVAQADGGVGIITSARGTAAGQSVAQATGGSGLVSTSRGNSAGVSDAEGSSGTSPFVQARGASQGSANAAAQSSVITAVAASGNASGSASAIGSGASKMLASGAGHAAGSGAGSGVGLTATLTVASGKAAGTTSASAVGSTQTLTTATATARGTGSALGSGSTSAISLALARAAGQSSALGNGLATKAAQGTAAGVGAAIADSTVLAPSDSWTTPALTTACPAIKVPPNGASSSIAGQSLCAAKPFNALGAIWQNDSGQTWNTASQHAIKFDNARRYMRFELHDTDWDHGLGDQGSNLSGTPEYFKRRAEAGDTESTKKFNNNIEYWLAFSFLQYWSDPAAMNSGGGNTRIYQWHWPSGNSPAFGFSAVGLGGSNMGFRVSTRQDDQSSNITRCTVPLVNGAANDVVVNCKVVDDGLGKTSSLANSFLRVWLNGTQVLDFTGGFGTYLEGSPHGGYTWRMGVYGQPLNGNHVIGVYGNLSPWPSSASLASRITAPPAWALSPSDWM